jgi:hypothetical protein
VKKLRLLVPIALVLFYVIISFILLGPIGGAGHGAGIGVFLDISFPAVLLAIAIDQAFPHRDLTVWLALIGGVLQYGLIGYVVGWWLTRKRNR